MKNSFIYTAPVSERWPTIDVLRGMAMFFLIPEVFLANYNVLPTWLWHASWNGLAFADLGVPVFLFAIGMSYELSFAKRIIQYGKTATVFHFLKRYLILFIFGFGGFWLARGKFQWEILQVIGLTGSFVLVFMFLKPLSRVLFSLIFVMFYQITCSRSAFGLVAKFIETGLGGPYATLAWSFPLLFGSSLANWINNKTHEKTVCILILWSIVLTMLGTLISYMIPFNKHFVSSSYILFTTGIATIGFLLFYTITDIGRKPIPVFNLIGRNALVCYIISQLLTAIVNKFLPHTIGTLLLIVISIIILLICITIVWILDKRKVYVRL